MFVTGCVRGHYQGIRGRSWIFMDLHYIDVHGAAGTAAGLALAPMAGASATDAAAKGARRP